MSQAARRVSAELLRRQIAAIFDAWGMPGEQAAVTVDKMVAADLCGIDSHGVAMFALYADFRRTGKLVCAPQVTLVRETPVTALFDGGGGLGHYPAHRAMTLAIEKCAAMGLGAAAVRNSNHYGAAGVYAAMAVERGFIGFSTTSVHTAAVVPTFGTASMFGTNPIAFAAPAGHEPPFLLDMATSTAAIGKLNLAKYTGRPIPEGWALDDRGRAVTDPVEGLKFRRLTPLGGTREQGSHKGYGLAAMVEILSTILPGAAFAPTRAARHPGTTLPNVGHFFLAIDPAAFRDDGGFRDDLDDMLGAVRATSRADPDQPVLIAGDPERAAMAERSRLGIPLSPAVIELVRGVAVACSAPFLLLSEGGTA